MHDPHAHTFWITISAYGTNSHLFITLWDTGTKYFKTEVAFPLACISYTIRTFIKYLK
jgi:hypothetical protein